MGGEEFPRSGDEEQFAVGESEGRGNKPPINTPVDVKEKKNTRDMQ